MLYILSIHSKPDLRGSIIMVWSESEIIESYIRQYDVIVDFLETLGVPFQQSLNVMQYITGIDE